MSEQLIAAMRSQVTLKDIRDASEEAMKNPLFPNIDPPDWLVELIERKII